MPWKANPVMDERLCTTPDLLVLFAQDGAFAVPGRGNPSHCGTCSAAGTALLDTESGRHARMFRANA
jgi:hypothetical protein